MDILVTAMLALSSLIVPVIIFIFGKINKDKPLKRNSFMGYRTLRSMLSDETFEYANRYISKVWYKISPFMFISPVIILLFLKFSTETQTVVFLIVTTVQIFIILFPCIHIEKYLKENFDEKGNKKSTHD